MFSKNFDVSKPYEKEVLNRLHHVQLEILKDFSVVCQKHSLPYFAIYGTAIGAVRHGGFIPWDDDIDVGMLREDYNRFCKIFEQELGHKYKLLTPEMDGRYACTVTHIQKRGTKFISQVSQNLKCEQCIFMDVFPFDCVAEDIKEQKKQAQKANFLGRLLFLAGTPYPYIPYQGWKKELAGFFYNIAHYGCKMFHITPKKIYKKYVQVATSYNGKGENKYVTSFEYTGCLKDKVRKEALFPLKLVRFEDTEIYLPANNHEFLSKVYGNYMKIPPKDKQINHMPYVLDFGDGINVVERNKSII